MLRTVRPKIYGGPVEPDNSQAINGEEFNLKYHSKTHSFAVSGVVDRSKSAHRLTFEAQVKVLKERIGDLETIRRQLGLSQRKMTQLLMVDPSAWTRWTKPGEDAPPHIYRALHWYLALNDKFPGLNPAIFLPAEAYSRGDSKLQQSLQTEIDKRTELENLVTAQSVILEDQNRQLMAQVTRLKKRLNLSLICGSLGFSAALVFFWWKSAV